MTKNYLPVNAADYPKTSAARTFMVESAEKYAASYEAALEKLTADDRMQKKVFAIQMHMAQHCAAFAAMGYNNAEWEGQLEKRENILRHQGILGAYEEALAGFSPDDRGAFVLYAHTNWFLHNAFLDQHIRKLRAAAENGHPEKAFEDRIILGTVYAICREWRQWWLENGTLPFDMWTYEDEPWTEDGTEQA